jgi:ABC-type molybdate transport system permease subunit
MGEVGVSLMLGGNILGRTETLSLAIFNSVTSTGLEIRHKTSRQSLVRLVGFATSLFTSLHNAG